MKHWKFTNIKKSLLVCLLTCLASVSAFAQPKATTTPREMGGVDLTGMVVFNRQVDKSFQVRDNASLFVSHRFGGAIRISTWDNPVVNLQAIIKVGAKNMTLAENFARSISIDINKQGDKIELSSVFPDAQASAAIGGYEVELFITVPANISITAENIFGDCHIAGIQQDVTVDVSFGGIYLSDIGGTVKVRAKGDYPLNASGIPKGGTFFLRGTQAHFSEIGGLLTIQNYLGSVTLEHLQDEADVFVTADNGSITLTLTEGTEPYLYATAEFNDITSDIKLERRSWGKTAIAHTTESASKQRIELNATFGEINIQTRTPAPELTPVSTSNTEIVKQTETTTIPVVPGHSLVINSMGGEILLEGVENSETIHIEVTRFVRIDDIQNAQDALNTLYWTHKEIDDALQITTYTQGDHSALGVVDYQVDLLIQYPMSIPIKVSNAKGETLVQHAKAPVVITQEKGVVDIFNAKAGVDITNHAGDIKIVESDGLLKAIAHNGIISTKRTQGALELESHAGKITIDTPRSSVEAHNTGGDIRIIALDGILGDFDIKTENGDISILITPESDALLVLNVNDGKLYSSFPVTGSVEKTISTFQGRLNKGTHRVVLQTKNGDIELN